MKNYRFQLRSALNDVVATAYSVNTAREWLRCKSIDETVWDGHAELEIETISHDLKEIKCKERTTGH